MSQKLPNAERNPGMVGYYAALFVNNPHFIEYLDGEGGKYESCIEAADLAIEYVNIMYDEDEIIPFNIPRAEAWLKGRV